MKRLSNLARSFLGLLLLVLLPLSAFGQDLDTHPDRLEAFSAAVFQAQVGLKELGYEPGSLDGRWGPSTQDAVRKFQTDIGLESKGRLGGSTLLLLQNPGHTRICQAAEIDWRNCLLAMVATTGAATASDQSCRAAVEACVDECEGTYDVYDYDSGNYIPVYNTDFQSRCRDACKAGLDACEESDPDDCCEEFEDECSEDCPSDVYDYDSGEYRFVTEAEDLCEDACAEGKDECEDAQ